MYNLIFLLWHYSEINFNEEQFEYDKIHQF